MDSNKATAWVFTYKAVKTVTIRDTPFSRNSYGLVTSGNPIYSNHVEEFPNPLGWQSHQHEGRRSRWANYGDTQRWVCIHDGITEYATLTYHLAVDSTIPLATTPTVTVLSPESETDLRGIITLAHQLEALAKHILDE
jgi:hypothetical protein